MTCRSFYFFFQHLNFPFYFDRLVIYKNPYLEKFFVFYYKNMNFELAL